MNIEELKINAEAMCDLGMAYSHSESVVPYK